MSLLRRVKLVKPKAVCRLARNPGVLLGSALAAVLAQTSLAQPGVIEEMLITGDGSQVTLPGEFAGGQVARGGRVGIFGNLDMMDTPFTSTSYTADLVENQQAQSVGDVLRNDPVVRVAKGFGNFQEVYVIRGFPVFSDDMTYNGLYGILPRQYVAAELLERVEVFRGASAFLNGASPGGSGLGGAVNLVPKRAGDEPATSLTAGYEEVGLGYLALDTSARFGAGDSLGIRVNAVKREGETAIKDQERDLSVLSLGMDYRGEQLRLSADVGFQDHRIDAPRPDVTPMGEIPKPPKADANYAQPWTYTDERQLFGVVRGEYDVNDQVTVWVAGGIRKGEEGNVLSGPNAFANGDTTAYRFDNVREDDVVSADTGIRTEFSTGNIGHRLILSASTYEMKERNAYAFSDFAGFAGNLYNPIAVAPPEANYFVGGLLADPLLVFKTKTSSVAIADVLSFRDDSVLLTLGARHQTIEKYSFDYNSGAPLSNYDESRVTPVVGLVIKPSEQISVYANYIEGLLPGEVAPVTSGGSPVTNAGEVFKPFQSEQFEIGIKYDAGTLGGALSVFTTDKPNAYVENNVFDIHGVQRNTGLELSVFGALAENFRVLGGVILLDAEMENTPGGLFNGNDPVGTPDTQININLEWDLLDIPGLTLDGRMVFTSDQHLDAANDISLASWTRFDVGARYNTQLAGKDLTLRLRIDNVTGKDYWASVGGYPGANYLSLGTPRTVALSGTINF